MDQTAFDRISALFAAKAARRNALAGAAGAGAAALAALPDAEAKPGSSKKKGKKPKQEEKTEFLFVQAAQTGTLSDNGDGSWNLVLQGHTGGTIYFSDRPQRVFGVSSTEQFLGWLGFTETNPPNAALLVSADGVEDAAIVELFDPTFDEATGRLTYTVRILGAYDEDGLSFIGDQVTDTELPAAFDQANLFIDDCPDFNQCCKDVDDSARGGASGPGDEICHPLPPTSQPTGACFKLFRGCRECWPGEQAALDALCVSAYGDGFTANTLG